MPNLESKLLDKVGDETKLSELTVGQFKALMGELFQDFLWKVEELLDEDLSLKPEIEEYLKTLLEDKAPFYSGEDIERELGLDE